MRGQMLPARVIYPSTSSLLTGGELRSWEGLRLVHPSIRSLLPSGIKSSFLHDAQSSHSRRGKKKKRGGREKKKGGKKRKFVTLHLAKARDQQQLPKAESLLSLPPGEWLPRSIQQKASFHRNWHKSGVIPSISMELLRIYGSVIQAAESCVLRATSPGFPAGDGAALLLQAAMLTVQQRRCHGLFYFSWCCHLQQMLCKQDLWRNHPLSHTAGEFWQSMTRRTFISLN